MRTLLITRGAPGCGKSTWIEYHGLHSYTLCPDELRLLCSSKELLPDGSVRITQKCEKKVWELFADILEYRMSRGDFTVVDATNTKTGDMKKYVKLAEQYRYKVYLVDFTNVPLGTCLERNKQRAEYKWVPDEVIEAMYERFVTNPVPKGITVIKPNEFDTVLESPFDVSEYNKLVFVGDIHGCYDTLMQYSDFKNGLKDDTEYIFLGDFVDRGNQNAEVMNFMFSIMNKPNVCIIEGNHERWIHDYGNNIKAKSNVFEENTKPELIDGGFDEKKARMFYSKVRQFSHLTYNGIEILACHGGIPNLDGNLLYISTETFVHGSGKYDDYSLVAESWTKQTSKNQYLVYGHRNTKTSDVNVSDRVFNLEGQVEFGGKLRIVECEKTTKGVKWNTIELDSVQPINKIVNTDDEHINTIGEAVAYLRNNSLVCEKKLDNDVSSFNFTREAFWSRNWSEQTILARGLFIDTTKNQIMARSYEKFFQIGETEGTKLENLKNTLSFPVKAYVKENGFLAIVSYDYRKDDLFIASKSTNKGDYVEYIKKQLEPYREKLLENLKIHYSFGKVAGSGSLSYVFECCDPENDPHIIEYDKPKIVLLDVILNDLEFVAFDYEMVKDTARIIGCPVKELAYSFDNWNEFEAFYNSTQSKDYLYNYAPIEGFVIVDRKGFMTKCKTGFYNMWKKRRALAERIFEGKGVPQNRMDELDDEDKVFKAYCENLYNHGCTMSSIIDLRKDFLKKLEFFKENA